MRLLAARGSGPWISTEILLLIFYILIYGKETTNEFSLTVQVARRGLLTLPKVLRDKYQIREGDQFTCSTWVVFL
jgi:hypothetical protein